MEENYLCALKTPGRGSCMTCSEREVGQTT